eukprot:TRINITY_DN8683_c0_g1_i2.p1 TRINITY_DN8683_c0_g1~~TRINITY_DN8683_c0_g1_i2.p1  ORF type:complete len:604 (-),score=113.70 TRINITY_DN8683_c0_g1_i2:1192-3003(-)
MTSYENTLKEFVKQIDSDAAKKKPSKIKSKPKTVVVGFQVENNGEETSESEEEEIEETIPDNTASNPIQIPAKDTTGTDETLTADVLTSPLSRSLEELKVYKTQISGWSKEDGDGIPPGTPEDNKHMHTPKPTRAERNVMEAQQNRLFAEAQGKMSPPTAVQRTAEKKKPSPKQSQKEPNQNRQNQKNQNRQQNQQKKQKGQQNQKQQKPKQKQQNQKKQKPKQKQKKNSQGKQYKRAAKVPQKSSQPHMPRQRADPITVPLFAHLPKFTAEPEPSIEVRFSDHELVHHSIVACGKKLAQGIFTGSNSRCLAMLQAFKHVIMDYQTPPEAALHRHLIVHLRPQIQYLIDCRPLAISMGNAIKYVKRMIHESQGLRDDVAKDNLIKAIDEYIEDQIINASEAIAGYGMSKINNGDVILTYARSHSILEMLKKAKSSGKHFRVIIVDSYPLKEGKALLRNLTTVGIHCTYVLINALSYAMKDVTKVFIGAHALLANGYVMSRAGTAMVATVAKAYHVPVIVCCEKYKFCERVQLDSICFNELGNPDVLIGETSELREWKTNPHLRLVNLIYDVTPSNLVTMVITEVGMIPPTSVPVVIREYSYFN